MDSVLVLVWTGIAFGFAYGVGHSVITLGARVWLSQFKPLYWPLALIECPACLGFWLGLATGAWISHDWFFALMSGLFTMATNFVLGRMTGLIPNSRGEENVDDGVPIPNAGGDDAGRAEGADSRGGEEGIGNR